MAVMSLSHWMIMEVKKFKNQKGQSLFEFLIFLPLLVMLIGVFYSFGGAMSMSINQQKAVRGYYFHLLKGNSFGISYPDLVELEKKGTRKVGFFSLGWRFKAEGEAKSYGSCFKINNMLSGNDGEECLDGDRPTEGSSRYIRAFTAFGLCGNNFVEQGGRYYWSEDPANGGRGNQIGLANCSLQ